MITEKNSFSQLEIWIGSYLFDERKNITLKCRTNCFRTIFPKTGNPQRTHSPQTVKWVRSPISNYISSNIPTLKILERKYKLKQPQKIMKWMVIKNSKENRYQLTQWQVTMFFVPLFLFDERDYDKVSKASKPNFWQCTEKINWFFSIF